jgi:acyl-CoA thioester hydrolase
MSARPLLSDFPVQLERAIEWGHMDAFQHVNNTVYFRFFEMVRIELFKRVGFGTHLENMDVGPILASTQCRYRIPLTFPDTVTIGARVAPDEISEDRFVMRYIVVSHAHQAVAATGDGLIVSYNYQQRAKAPLPAQVKDAILAL